MRALPRRWSFSMGCLVSVQNRRCANRSALRVVPSINCEKQRVPTCLLSIFQLASRVIQAKPIASYRDLLKEKADVWAVGPGLGKSRAAEILELVEKAKQPMVLDADGLNIVSEKTSVLKRCKGKRLLTPHPGEMKRLFSKQGESRAKIATTFCDRFAVTLLFKGSRTIVAERGRPLSYNTTGNPGMATGGMGDVLTGVCAGLLGQGLSPYDAARLGAWVCGRAAEMSIFNAHANEQSLLATDVLERVGNAFKEMQTPPI